MSSSPRDLIDDYLAFGWTTYGLADLERLVRKNRYAATDDALDNFELLTRLLFQLKMFERGKEHIENWLDANSDHHAAPRYRLRLVFYLNELKDHHAALAQLETLMGVPIDSPPLFCLKANLMNKSIRPRESIIAAFEEVIAKAPQWTEPKIELLEQRILHRDFAKVRQNANDHLKRGGITLRDHLVISALRLVARFCQDPKSWEEPDFQAEMTNLRASTVPHSQREEWHFDDVCDMLLEMAMADTWLKKAAMELRDWLKALELKLRKE